MHQTLPVLIAMRRLIFRLGKRSRDSLVTSSRRWRATRAIFSACISSSSSSKPTLALICYNIFLILACAQCASRTEAPSNGLRKYHRRERHDGTTARRHDGTTARRHDGTTARRHDGTTARRHDGTTARRHGGTTARRRDPQSRGLLKFNNRLACAQCASRTEAPSNGLRKYHRRERHDGTTARRHDGTTARPTVTLIS